MNPQEGKLIYSIRREETQDFYDVWLFLYNIDIPDLSLQESEVIEAKWMSRNELDDIWDKGQMHPLLEYYKTLLP